MEIFIIFSAIALIAAFIWNVTSKDTRMESAFVLMFTTILLFITIDAYIQQDYPTAKSVYEGKTTLEITYRDSIPIDTVVVYKPEYRKNNYGI